MPQDRRQSPQTLARQPELTVSCCSFCLSEVQVAAGRIVFLRMVRPSLIPSSILYIQTSADTFDGTRGAEVTSRTHTLLRISPPDWPSSEPDLSPQDLPQTWFPRSFPQRVLPRSRAGHWPAVLCVAQEKPRVSGQRCPRVSEWPCGACRPFQNTTHHSSVCCPA